MSSQRYFDCRVAAIVLLLLVVGCGEPKTKTVGPVGARGKKDPRLIKPIEPPNESGKAILAELGATDLQPTRRVSEIKPSLPEEEKKKSVAKAKPTGKSDLPYRRPSRWVSVDELPYETWEVQYLGGNRPIGYVYQRVSPSSIGSGGIYRVESDSFVRIQSGNQRVDQRLKITSMEEEDGRLKTIEANLDRGDAHWQLTGNVILGSLRGKSDFYDASAGIPKTTGFEIPWPKENGGPFVVAQSLRGKPMKPGEIRNLSMLDPTIGEVVHVELKAKDYVKTPLLDQLQYNLLEVSFEVKHKANVLTSTLWVNKAGEIQKNYNSTLDTRSFRAERTFAENVRDSFECEAFTKSQIDLDAPIQDVDKLESLVFQVRHPDLDPARVLPGKTNQSVKSITAFTANATIFAMREKSPIPEGVTPELSEDPLCLKSSPIIESEDPLVKKLASQFSDDATLGKLVLERLRRGVYQWIENKTPFAPTMQSAAETARSRSGDSSEHAFLLAAVVRSRGVPSRVAVGLVYNASKTKPAMVLHMWTEVYLKDHWVSIDAFNEQAATNATYLKLVDTPMADHNRYAALLSALKTIEVLDISLSESK